MKKFRESVKKPGFLDNTFAILYFQRVGILLSRITQAMLAMTGRVTMLGISRSTVLVEVIGLYNGFYTRSYLGPPYYGCFSESIYGVLVKLIY